MRRNGLVGCIAGIIIIVIALIIISMCTVRVPAGYAAVQYRMNGGVQDEVLLQGWHVVPPTIHTTNYTIGIEQSYLTAGDNGDSSKDESFSCSSSEGKELTLEMTFTYQYNTDSVTKVFTQFKGQSGKEVRDTFIKPNMISWTKEVVARYKVADILGEKRAEVNGALTEYLSSKFEPYGISVSNVSMSNITVDEDTMAAINKKITAQQEAETQAITNQTNIDKAAADATVATTTAQAEADAKVIEAEGNAKVIETNAAAEAEATRIQAEAEAEANTAIGKSLTDDVLHSQWIDSWNGQLPTYMTDGSEGLYLGVN